MEATEEFEFSFQQYWLILKRRWLPAVAVFSSVFTLTALLTYLQKPVYESKGQLLLKETSTALSDLGAASTLDTLNSSSSNPQSTEAEIIKSVPIIQKTIAILKLKDQEGNPLTPAQFLKKLQVAPVQDTTILDISYQSTNPRQAAAIVNQLIQVYLANNITSNRAEATSARKFVEKQLPKAEAKVEELELALRKFKEDNRTVDVKAEATSAVQITGDLEKQLADVQSQLADANARSLALRNKVGMSSQQAIAVNSLSQSPAVQQVLTEYQKIESDLAVAQTLYQSEHPAILNLKEKEAALQSILRGRIGQVVGNSTNQPVRNLQAGSSQQKIIDQLIASEVERLGLANKVTALSSQRANYKQQMTAIPRLEQIQGELQRKLSVAQSTFEALLKSYQEISIRENQNIGNVRTIATALVPEVPISPRIPINLAIGGALGVVLGIGAAVILEAMDTSIKTVKEAKDIFDYTLLGNIPLLKGSEKVTRNRDLERPTPTLPVRDNPRSSISEAYRMLQANLKFLSSDKALRVLAITSSVPKEGKSTVSANLALAMAELGHRILIIDADMRRPSQHQIWELPNTEGLSNVLVGQTEVRMAVRKEAENLDVLTSGVLPPNPLALIDSKRMASLIDTCCSEYDYVLIDTPPLAVAADALILGKIADGILVVARPGVVDSGSANSAKAALEQSDQNILGLAVNGVIPDNEPNSYYYYYAQGYYTDEASETSTKKRSRAKAADPSPGTIANR
jgi:capsular exopolysaccharide synthesis family protein